MQLKKDSFIVIKEFMVSELNLKGNELIVYAIIYGFKEFTGSLNYLCKWTNSTKQGVLKNLQSLVKKGYVTKKDILHNGVKYCSYYATEFNTSKENIPHGKKDLLRGKKNILGVKESLTGVLNSVEQDIKLSLPNNIDNIIDNNKDNNIEDNPSIASQCDYYNHDYDNIDYGYVPPNKRF